MARKVRENAVFGGLRDAALLTREIKEKGRQETITGVSIKAKRLHELHFKHPRLGNEEITGLVGKGELNPAVLESALNQIQAEKIGDSHIDTDLTRRILLALSHTPLQERDLIEITGKNKNKVRLVLGALRDLGVIVTISKKNIVSYGFLNPEKVRDEARPFVEEVQKKLNTASTKSNIERRLLSKAGLVGVGMTTKKGPNHELSAGSIGSHPSNH